MGLAMRSRNGWQCGCSHSRHDPLVPPICWPSGSKPRIPPPYEWLSSHSTSCSWASTAAFSAATCSGESMSRTTRSAGTACFSPRPTPPHSTTDPPFAKGGASSSSWGSQPRRSSRNFSRSFILSWAARSDTVATAVSATRSTCSVWCSFPEAGLGDPGPWGGGGGGQQGRGGGGNRGRDSRLEPRKDQGRAIYGGRRDARRDGGGSAAGELVVQSCLLGVPIDSPA
eukprot:COSAG04_NODE_535_length_12932_cov_12.604223_7_plen_227_part_00